MMPGHVEHQEWLMYETREKNTGYERETKQTESRNTAEDKASHIPVIYILVWLVHNLSKGLLKKPIWKIDDNKT